MKRFLMSTVLILFISVCVFAEEWTDDNGTVWTYGIWNTNEAYIQWVSNCPKHVVVPSEIDGHTVTCIGYQQSTSGAKYGLCDEEVESFELPSTISTIGYGAFYKCASIVSISGLNTCKAILEHAFQDCTSLTSIGDIGACESIGNSAFNGCISLINIGDPSECKSIGHYAFYGCTSLTNIGNLDACKSIGYQAFYGCTSLTNIGNLDACESIGDYAFKNCTSLTNIGNLDACESIGSLAFSGCESLAHIGNLSSLKSIVSTFFSDCRHSLIRIGNLSACTSIDKDAFNGCTSLTSIGDLSACTSIGTRAFLGCHSLTSVGNLVACSSIGSAAFGSCYNLLTLTICNSTPPTLGSKFDRTITIKVPEDVLEAYRSANVWKEFPLQIIPNNVETDYTGERRVLVAAQDNGSGLLAALGSVDPTYVVHLEIEGTMNSYDIFVIRNKMPNLHVLDMTNIDIVTNAYPYYDSYSTMNNEMQGYEFYEQTKLVDVRLPKSVKNVGPYSFSQCTSLRNILIPEGVERISDNAFSFLKLKSINIPESVKYIDDQSFLWCEYLESVHFPKNLLSIGDSAFCCCNIKSLELPDGLREIGTDAFLWNSPLKEVILPGSIKSVGDNAFGNCSALKSVKSKLVDPFTIGQNTFSTWTTATLYVPMTDEWNATFNRYYWDTQWGQFAHIEGWNPTINDFYIDNDYDLDGGTIGGEDNRPDADMNHHAGFHVKGHGHQKFHHVHIKHNGSTSGSMIGDESNLKADRLFSDIEVLANRWYFFSFPFNIRIADIKVPGNRVFRYYDGKERAEKAIGGWKNLPKDQEYLEAGVGYIFQTNKAGTLVLPVDNPDFATDNKQPDLEVHASSNNQDASWNFVGNPYLSYYMLEDLDFSAPITVWNGSSYEAVRPGDDDYLIQPYQAFFVQKPSVANVTNVGFNPNKRTTYTKGNILKNNAKAKRAKSSVRADRQLINISITDGENTDKTRIVFNDACQMGYEAECDAAKFISTENVPQIYSVNNNVQYAINERPNGSREVNLGVSVKSDGTFTISAMRMDTPMLLKDIETGITTDLSENSYTFDTKVGTYNSRFMLVSGNETTGVENVENLTVEDVTYYDLSGKRVNKTHRGVKIANGKKTL